MTAQQADREEKLPVSGAPADGGSTPPVSGEAARRPDDPARRPDNEPGPGADRFAADPTEVTSDSRRSVAPAGKPTLRTWQGPALLAGLGAAVVVTAMVAAGIGAYSIPLGDVVASVLDRCGIGGHRLDQTADAVLWEVRFPRIVLTVLIGASLGCAGALMQGVFGNPLAEPGVVGVSAGATVGAVLVIFTGATTLGAWTQPASAFVFGLGTTVLVYVFSRSGGRTEVVTLILTGVALTAVTTAAIGILTSYSTNDQIQDIAFWQLGSVNGATWEKIWAIAPCAAVGLGAAPFFARRLDLLALGEKPARHLGVDVEPRELPIGALTSLVGGPVFFILLRRARMRAGGWG